MDQVALQASNVAPLQDHAVSDGNGALVHAAESSGDARGTIFGLIRKVGLLFSLTVLAPTILATAYFGFFASDIYASESRYVVRSPEKPQKADLGMLLGGAGFSAASEEVRAAQGYIESRDALRAINADDYARKAWGNVSVSIFDRFNPLGWSGSFEDLYEFYSGKVEARYDSDTGITVLKVQAFSPLEAQTINARLLQNAERLVNQLNERGRKDLVLFAEQEVADAKAQAADAAQNLAAYRNEKGVIDPERQATVQLQMISKLQDELIGARLQLLQLSRAASQNPQIPLLKVRIAGLEQAIKQELGEVAGSTGSLSATAAEFQRLQVQREFADKQLGLSLAALQDARNESRRQGAYVERVAQPSLPDDAMAPRRARGVLATFILGLIAWGIGRMLLAGVREHQL